MGIEPTWDFVEPHAGFEDQERHQVAPHLRDENGLADSHENLARFGREYQSKRPNAER